jgi:hypothetical protein
MIMSRCSITAPQCGMSGGRKTRTRRTCLGPVCEGATRVDLSQADLRDANLRGTNLSAANLAGAHLDGVHLFKAVLDGASFDGAFLYDHHFCGHLTVTHNWQSAFRDEMLVCGVAIPDRTPRIALPLPWAAVRPRDPTVPRHEPIPTAPTGPPRVFSGGPAPRPRSKPDPPSTPAPWPLRSCRAGHSPIGGAGVAVE